VSTASATRPSRSRSSATPTPPHWFPALERLAKHERWRIVTFVKVACPFIDMRVGNVALKREYRECADFNEATIAVLGRLRPDLTIVSMSRIAIHP
jgi:hypothetical protein